MLNRFKCFLFQPEAEADPGFRRQVEETARRGLRIIGLVTAAIPTMAAFVRVFFGSTRSLEGAPFLLLISALPIGLGAYAVGRWRTTGTHARLLGCIAGFAVGPVLIWSALLESSARPEIAYTVPARMMLLLMVAVVSLPLRPWDTLALGLSLKLAYLLSLGVVLLLEIVPAESAWNLEVAGALLVLVVVATLLSSVSYRRMFESYSAHLSELRAAEELHRAEKRVLLSDSAASMGRFAATLSHELNSPLGALRAAIETLNSIPKKRATVSTESLPRLNEVEADLHGTARASVDRLAQTVARMQRLTNLDRAELHPVDLNALLEDVVAMLRSKDRNDIPLQLQLEPLREIIVRPHQISAVFSSLIEGALASSARKDRISIASRQQNSTVEVDVNVPGDSAQTLTKSLEPDFQIREGRVTGGHWSLFTARQIVREHGGEINAVSLAGPISGPTSGPTSGIMTRIRVTLPLDEKHRAARAG